MKHIRYTQTSLLVLALTALAMPAKAQYKKIMPIDSVAPKHQIGSVDVIDEKRMNKGLVTNTLQAISGQAAGLNVQTGADRMAILNSVRVRGTTSLTGGNAPLIIIDGVYSDISALNILYPADIESFSILKNAAETAPYGARGASGVIVVTTKKGQSKQFHISYDGNIGIESVSDNINMLDASSYVATAQALGKDYVDGGYNTNFSDVLTRTGFVQNHHIAFSGGSDTQNYRASLALMQENTVIKNNGYKNFVAKIDVKQKAFDDLLTIDLGVTGSTQKNNEIDDIQKLFYSAAAQNPTYPAAMNASGGWDRNTNASQINNPLATLYRENKDKIMNFNTHMKFTFQLTPSLTATLFGSYSYTSDENDNFKPTWVWAQGQASRYESKREDWLGHVMLDYQHTWGKHHLEAKAMAEYQSSNTNGFGTLVKGFANNVVSFYDLQAGYLMPFGGTTADYINTSLMSFLGQVDYRLMDRYTLSVNARADGSSLFADGNKWAVFPSVSLVWNMKQENFMKHIDWLSQLDVRAGYGISGNLGGVEAYNSLSLLNPSGLIPWQGSMVTTYNITNNANPNLKWESRGTFNIGADMALWNNKLVLKAEYYYSKTWDMLYLYDVPVPPYPFNKMLANLGTMSNQGLEFGIGYTPIHKKDMELNINVNMAWQKNKLLSLSGDYDGNYFTAPDRTSIGQLNGAGFHGGNNNIVYQIVGQPLGVFYLPHCEGLQTNADGTTSYKIADLNHDDKVDISDGEDRYIAGQATPKWTLGSNISFRYKQWDIALQMNGAFGHKIYNGTSLTYMNMSSFPDYNVMHDAPLYRIQDQTATDYWLESGDYLNFEHLTIGWNVPVNQNRFISSIRVALSINNLGTISSYSGLTPMINSFAVNNTLGIDDKRSYPPYRSYSVSFAIQF